MVVRGGVWSTCEVGEELGNWENSGGGRKIGREPGDPPFGERLCLVLGSRGAALWRIRFAVCDVPRALRPRHLNAQSFLTACVFVNQVRLHVCQFP